MTKSALRTSLLLTCVGIGGAGMACSAASSETNTAPPDGSAPMDGSRHADGSVRADGSAGADASGQADGAELGDGACHWPADLGDAGPTVTACSVGRAFVECMYPSGATCECISDDPTTCTGCGLADAAATCQSKCAANQYAVSCGGVPGMTYQTAPTACVGVASSPEGNEYSCCPCQ
jgi:hypothetical protein